MKNAARIVLAMCFVVSMVSGKAKAGPKYATINRSDGKVPIIEGSDPTALLKELATKAGRFKTAKWELNGGSFVGTMSGRCWWTKAAGTNARFRAEYKQSYTLMGHTNSVDLTTINDGTYLYQLSGRPGEKLRGAYTKSRLKEGPFGAPTPMAAAQGLLKVKGVKHTGTRKDGDNVLVEFKSSSKDLVRIAPGAVTTVLLRKDNGCLHSTVTASDKGIVASSTVTDLELDVTISEERLTPPPGQNFQDIDGDRRRAKEKQERSNAARKKK